MSTVEVHYELYEKQGSSPAVYARVSAAADVAIESALRTSDTRAEVEVASHPSEQCDVLDEHVQGVSFDFPVLGHVVVFEQRADSRWDPNVGQQGGWITVTLGGAIAYPVVPPNTDGGSARLFLHVYTEGAAGDPDADG